MDSEMLEGEQQTKRDGLRQSLPELRGLEGVQGFSYETHPRVNLCSVIPFS